MMSTRLYPETHTLRRKSRGNLRNRPSALEKAGTPIGPLDTQIGAHSLSLGSVLVTNNTREFGRIPGLEVEDWTA